MGKWIFCGVFFIILVDCGEEKVSHNLKKQAQVDSALGPSSVSYIIAYTSSASASLKKTFTTGLKILDSERQKKSEKQVFLAELTLTLEKEKIPNFKAVEKNTKVEFLRIDFKNKEDADSYFKEALKREDILFIEPNSKSVLHIDKVEANRVETNVVNTNRVHANKMQDYKESDSNSRRPGSSKNYTEWFSWWQDMISLPRGLSLIDKDKTLFSKKIVIAVFDSGVDGAHELLKNNMWKNPRPGFFGCGEDTFGCDTTAPTDTKLGNPTPYPYGLNGSGEACEFSDGNQKDLTQNCIHGTHISGIIAASSKKQPMGICPFCEILPIKVVEEINGEGVILDSSVLSALRYISLLHKAYPDQIKIVNMSFGKFHHSRSVELFIDHLTKEGVLFVASAGNENTSRKSYPAAYKNVLAVGALDTTKHKTSYTNYGDWISIAAPGGSNGSYDSMMESTAPGNRTHVSFGTSVAAPVVSAIAALIWNSFPNMSALEVKAHLLRFSEPLEDFDYKVGLVNLEQALRANRIDGKENTPPQRLTPLCGSIENADGNSTSTGVNGFRNLLAGFFLMMFFPFVFKRI